MPSNSIEMVCCHYRIYHPRARPGEKERRLIANRIKEGYSVEDLNMAIDGCHLSPFHCGENDRDQKYQKLSLIMRDSDHVLQFLEYAEEVEKKKKQAEMRTRQFERLREKVRNSGTGFNP